jgi:phenol hydroxylase P5 protein
VHNVTIEPLGQTIAVAAGQTILDACLREGIWLPHACCHGLCGTCKVTVLKGFVDHGASSPFALMDFERDENKALACSAVPLGDLVIEAEIDEDADAMHFPIRDFAGEVAETRLLTPDILGIWIRLPNDGLTFQAGQYINLEIPGVAGHRPFSCANAPSQRNLIELHVRRVQGGLGTTWLHEYLKAGQKLEFSAPYGRFFVRLSAAKPLLFLAGGSGLSGPKSMLLDLLDKGWPQPITLVHGVRGRKDLYFTDLFFRLQSQHPNFTYVPALSAPDPGDAWEGEMGFVHEVAERQFRGKFKGWQAYLCGPPLMVEACIRVLMQGRLFERDIFTEKFATAADGKEGLARSPLFRKI